jgi:uracil-DNA glycosylase
VSAEDLIRRIAACRICADRFAGTATAHVPRPVPWFAGSARLLISGQAPGLRVHGSGVPFDDASGQRLRDWLGLDRAGFYDRARVAVVPMGFCFPGYDAKGADLPPPSVCARTWRAEVLAALPEVRLRVLVGGPAISWHLGKGGVEPRVRDWARHAGEGIWPLPHPSWRNTGWLKRNPWFAAELVPALRAAVRQALA